jgi:nucleotide-binding universal stress UspA family protein
LAKPAEEKTRTGRVATLILDEVTTQPYDLVVVGSRGRRGWQRLAFGSVAARLARYSPIPVLIIKGERVTFRRILACTSGDVRGERAARWGGQFAHWFNAQSTVLHVMSQIPFSPRSKLDELAETAEQAMHNRTHEGEHLSRAIELMYAHDAPHPVAPKLRYGLVRDEIVAEVIEGDYDLIVLGGHQAPDFEGQANIIRDYLLEDITDQILMAVDRPMLIVKGA